MKLNTKRTLGSVVFTVVVAGAAALAGKVTLPFTFTAGAPIKAAEVNQTLTAVKTAVDESDERIAVLEAKIAALSGVETRVKKLEDRPCPAGTTPVGNWCVDNTPGKVDSFSGAIVQCNDEVTKRVLCPSYILQSICSKLEDDTWANHYIGSTPSEPLIEYSVTIARSLSGGNCFPNMRQERAISPVPKSFYCCKPRP